MKIINAEYQHIVIILSNVSYLVCLMKKLNNQENCYLVLPKNLSYPDHDPVKDFLYVSYNFKDKKYYMWHAYNTEVKDLTLNMNCAKKFIVNFFKCASCF